MLNDLDPEIFILRRLEPQTLDTIGKPFESKLIAKGLLSLRGHQTTIRADPGVPAYRQCPRSRVLSHC